MIIPKQTKELKVLNTKYILNTLFFNIIFKLINKNTGNNNNNGIVSNSRKTPIKR